MPAAVQARREAGRLASPTLRSLAHRRLAELAAVVLALVGVALLLALASYDPRDPSFNTATVRVARNMMGQPGALVADLLLQGFGFAGLLPGIALLAWAWRIGSHRGLANLPLRVIALVAALPVSAAVLAAIPGPKGEQITWPTEAGPGGAAGAVAKVDVLAAGQDLLGAAGPVLVWTLAAILAGMLVVLALGLTAGEWHVALGMARRAGGAARAGGGMLGRALGRAGSASVGVLQRINGSRPERESEPEPVPVAEPTAAPAFMPRREPRITMPPAAESAPPAARALTGTAIPPPPPAAEPPKKVPVVPKKPTPAPAPLRQESFSVEAGWRFPPLDLLKPPPSRANSGAPTEEALQANARLLESVLSDYGVQGQIVEIRPGPVVTLYELEPAPGIRSARVIGLADDVARSLSVTAVRIATVSGRNVIGIEVPNARRETVYLSELLNTEAWQKHPARLALTLGKDIGGGAIIADLARMPHLLVAGTTGSGKSVGINAMIMSLLYRLSPDQCRLILIDPKMLELSVYDGIPHLMAPVVTEPAKAVVALKWTVREMERRYRAMSQLGVRNIGGYNDRVAEAQARGEVVTRRVQTGFDPETGKPIFEEVPLALEKLPFIVVVIDEMADLMMVAGKEIEAAVQRLAQMARAAGIHVIMATQRPSVDVITGTIKANFPTRISFQVISKFDSRTILGEQGAEQLLGQGDMLYMIGGGRITRVHGPFVSDREVEDVVAFLREQGEPQYLEEVTEAAEEGGEGLAMSGIAGASDGEKGLFDQAVAIVSREGKASTSFIQRHLQIGYNRAARLIEQMEKEGIVGPANHVGKREVLVRRTSDDD
ncbi:DNA translocase FtsK [Rhodovastum atsumiense]|uniref:DNA translocase FtsK n=1 Tax=Rhodovastum atsumiense TaxID=504468 RepID=A0A5M6IQ19_9PROT|nr:DNA translocase FtsK 4TM domain-containing protein [Rhodovastum atsumiense]KAA5610372.1 cell division protein FtsK [Rhodovastum atsumiense]CAH2600881.1 DNA translocase FtsK [Rhodovastum atsumiense]